MSLDPEDVQRVRDTATAFAAVGAVGALLYRISKAVRDRTCAGLAWAQDWAAVPGRVAHLADTTERRFTAVEDELATTTTHVGLSLDRRGLLHWRTDLQGNCTSASPGLCRLLGVSEADMLGRGWISSIHPEDHDIGVEQFLDAVGDRRTWTGQYRVRTSAGPVYITAIARPVVAGGRCVGYVGCTEQITGPTEGTA